MLQCPYHGWRFDQRGCLRGIPGAPPGAPIPQVSVTEVPVLEHDGVVWARYRDGDAALPERVRALDSAGRKFLWQTVWQAHVVDALENVLDPLHTHFVHAGLVRRAGVRRQTRVSLVPTPEGFVVDYQGQGAQSGLVYRLFESPRESERAYFCAPGTAQLEYRYRNGSRACISLHFSPESSGRTRLIGALHVEGRRVAPWMVRAFLWPFIRRVARQDQRMLAWQAENTRAFVERKDVITRFDLVRRQLLASWSEPRGDADSGGQTTEIVLDL